MTQVDHHHNQDYDDNDDNDDDDDNKDDDEDGDEDDEELSPFQLLEYQWREGRFDKLTPSSLPPNSMFMTER